MTSIFIEPSHRAGASASQAGASAFLAALVLALAACTTAPPKPPAPPPAVSAPAVIAPPVAVRPLPPVMPAMPVMPGPSDPPASSAAPLVEAEPPLQIATATTPRDYRRYGANHLYARHRDRIFKGKLPPLLYAVGALNVSLDSRGAVRRIEWLREPKHAPEVVAEIERMVRAAAPFPAPVRMGGVVYTDIWLWDKSGRFQLDTLTEGQLAALPAATDRSASPVKSVADRRRVPAKKASEP